MITAVMFDGKNYDLWEQAVRKTLKAKNKLVFIDQTLQKPKSKEGGELSELQTWETVNFTICSWTFNMIESRLWNSIAFVEME